MKRLFVVVLSVVFIIVGFVPIASARSSKSTRSTDKQVIAFRFDFPEQCDSLTTISRCTIIDIETQQLGCYEFGQLVRTCNISGAKTKDGYHNALGEWEILQKARSAYSQRYRAPVPYASRIENQHWIHQGNLPGYPASHGCVRMSGSDAKWFYNWNSIGDCGYSCKKARLEFNNAAISIQARAKLTN